MGDGNSTGVNKLTKTIRQERIPKNGTEDNDLAPMIWNFAFGVWDSKLCGNGYQLGTSVIKVEY